MEVLKSVIYIQNLGISYQYIFYIYVVAYRPVATQRPRNKQLYNGG
jgi:hypothetical protein